MWLYPAESDYIAWFKRSACFLLISLKQNVSYLLATASYGTASVLWTSICCVLLHSTLCQINPWGTLLLDVSRLLHMHCFTCIYGCLQNSENSFAIYMLNYFELLNVLNFDWKEYLFFYFLTFENNIYKIVFLIFPYTSKYAECRKTEEWKLRGKNALNLHSSKFFRESRLQTLLVYIWGWVFFSYFFQLYWKPAGNIFIS